MQSDKREQTEGKKKRENRDRKENFNKGRVGVGEAVVCDNPVKLIRSNSEHFTRSDCYEGLQTK